MRLMHGVREFIQVSMPIAAGLAVMVGTEGVRAAAPGITGPTFNLVSANGIPQPARRVIGLFVGLWMQRCAEWFCAGCDYECYLPNYADPRSDTDCYRGTNDHGDADQWSTESSREHFHPFPWIPGGGHRRRPWPTGAGGSAGWYGDLHLYGYIAWDARVLQRNAE